jgi:hypothetical protein
MCKSFFEESSFAAVFQVRPSPDFNADDNAKKS